jgi:hypothetical protein
VLPTWTHHQKLHDAELHLTRRVRATPFLKTLQVLLLAAASVDGDVCRPGGSS